MYNQINKDSNFKTNLNEILNKSDDIEKDLKNLFNDLKGSNDSNKIDSSTFISLLVHLQIHKEEPEFFYFIQDKYKNKFLSEEEFIDIFKNPEIINSNNPEEIKNLFKIFDYNKRGSVSMDEFKEFLSLGPLYQNNKIAVEENLNEIFTKMKDLYGNSEMTPLEFFHIINQVSETLEKK